MTFVLVAVLVLVGTGAGFVFGTILGANARAEIEQELADVKRRLLARNAYEEHA